MAVIVRSVRGATALVRALESAGIPLAVPGATTPLRDEPAVAALLDALDAVAEPGRLEPELLERLAVGPLVGADPLRWRRLRHAARRAALADHPGAETVSSRDALARVCLAVRDVVAGLSPLPQGTDGLAGLPGTVAQPLLRLAGILRAGHQVAAGGAEADHVLWTVWDATGLADRWRRTALAAGPDAPGAGADLDAVIALFAAAADWVGRHPRGGPGALADEIRSRAVGDDRLGPDGSMAAVTLTTPASAAGRQWPLVVVAGVQDGVWPNPRLRGSLLRSDELVDLLDDRDVAGLDSAARRSTARRAVVADETRLFHVAVSRASEALVVTAAAGGAAAPSELCRLVDPEALDRAAAGEPMPGSDLPEPAQAGHGHTLAGLVATLRRALVDPARQPPDRAEAARLLARLSAAGVRGATPSQWSWLRGPSTASPRLAGGTPAVVSPSAVDTFLTCPLRWYLTSVGGRGPRQTAQDLGTLVHRALELHPSGSAAELLAAVDAGWDGLELDTPWLSARERLRAERMVAKTAGWLAAQAAAGYEPLAAERSFTLDEGVVRVRGTVDRVERAPDGRVRLVDLKTGASSVSAAEGRDSPQLLLYQLAAAREALGQDTAGEPAGGLLLYVGTGTVSAVAREQPALGEGGGEAQVQGLLGEVGHGMAASAFEARPSKECAHCPVRSSCPAQVEGRRVPPPFGTAGASAADPARTGDAGTARTSAAGTGAADRG